MEFKDRLRHLREEKQLSAAQLAGEFEKSEGAIRMWETGKSKPDADTLIKLSKYFDCTVDYLLGLSDFKNQENVVATTEQFNRMEAELLSLEQDTRNLISSSFISAVHGINTVSVSPDIQKVYITSLANILNTFPRYVESIPALFDIQRGADVNMSEEEIVSFVEAVPPSIQEASSNIQMNAWNLGTTCTQIVGFLSGRFNGMSFTTTISELLEKYRGGKPNEEKNKP